MELLLVIERAAGFLRPGGLVLIGLPLDAPALLDHLDAAIRSSGLETLSLPAAPVRRPGMVGYALAQRPVGSA